MAMPKESHTTGKSCVLLKYAWVLLCVLLLSSACDPKGSSRSGQELWQQVGLRGTLIHSIALSDDTAWAATNVGLYKRSGTGDWSRLLPGTELWDVQTSSHGQEVVAAGNNGDVYISHNTGATWKIHFLTPLGAYAVTIRPSNPDWILAGAGGGIFLTTDAGLRWHRVEGLGTSAASAFSWIQGSNSVLAAGAIPGPAGRQSPAAVVSHDGGLHWSPLGNGLPSAGVMALASLPGEGLVAGTMGYGVWVRDSLSRWRRRSTAMPRANDHGATIVVVPGKSPRIYVGTVGFGVFRSDTAINRWTSVSDGLPSTDGSRIVLSLAYDAKTHSLLAGTSQGLYELSLLQQTH